MGKQHQTFPGEPEEMPQGPTTPEIKQPQDPSEPAVPQENPDNVPIELPPGEQNESPDHLR